MKLHPSLDRFFFAPMHATGFGLMRMAWASVTLLYLYFQRTDVGFFYGRDGIVPPDLMPLITRPLYRFTIFDWIQDPAIVFAMYVLLLLSLALVCIGYQTRIMTIISVVLLYSFHEQNVLILGGGDTVLRTIGFILMIAPGITAFSVDRLRQQWPNWKKHHTLMPPVTMPTWPWRLLLWQLIILYLTSLWYKFIGSTWQQGTAIDIVLHHPVYARWPTSLTNYLLPITAVSAYVALLWEALWALLLVPRPIVDLLPRWMRERSLRRWLILGGVLFHGGIFILLDAGVFSLAIFVAYLGLLRKEDFVIMKNVFDHSQLKAHSSQLVILYDGHCGLCQRSVFWLTLLDHLHRLKLVDFRDAALHKQHAPDVIEKELDKALHIKLPNDSYKTGFDAFRVLAWHLPSLWLAAPFLYIPGIAPIGRLIYANIAAGRAKCSHEGCRV